MQFYDAEQVRAALPWRALVDALRAAFRAGCVAPPRLHYDVEVPAGRQATLLVMPAWQEGAYIGVKVVSVFPDNAERGMPAIHGNYLLSSGTTGELLAVLDGGELTARRTAAASALAADYLARRDARRLLMVGTGRLSRNLIEAHATVRPLTTIQLWGRKPDKAQALAAAWRAEGLPVTAVSDLAAACREADIISCATLSSEPLVRGEWLRPGTHLDLVGAFKPSMRETDDSAIMRSRLFVDTREGVGTEGGDIVTLLQRGVLQPEAMLADLHELCRNQHPGRRNDDEITCFKSVGASLEDLAAAVSAYRRYRASP